MSVVAAMVLAQGCTCDQGGARSEPLVELAREQTLLPPASEGGGAFGAILALGDPWLVVGQRSGDNEQHLFVFHRGDADAPPAELPRPEGFVPGALFGASLAVVGDRIVVGAPNAGSDAEGDLRGSVHLYVRDGESWRHHQSILPADLPTTARARFGHEVAFDEQRLIVSAPGVETGGVLYTYELRDGLLRNSVKISAGEQEASLDFGAALALSGQTLLVGAPGGQQANATGAVLAYDRRDGSWSLAQRISSPSGEGAQFGAALAMDGDTAVVGAPLIEGGGGAVHVLRREGSRWQLGPTLEAPDNEEAFFGQGLAINDTLIVVASPGGSLVATSRPGAVHLFRRCGARWSTAATLAAPLPRRGDSYGQALGLEGRLLVTAAPNAITGRGGEVRGVLRLDTLAPLAACSAATER